MKNKTLFFQSRWIIGLQKPIAILMAIGLSVGPVIAQPPLPVPVPVPVPVPEPPAAPGNDANANANTDANPILPPSPARPGEKLLQLNFRDSPLDQVLDLIADLTGKTIIKSPGLNATITLKSQTRLNVTESMQAIEAVLSMNNITLVPMGEKFLRAVQTAQARQEGMTINIDHPEKAFSETDKLISQVFTLKYIELAEIQPIIQSLLHGYGKIQPLDRANSLLVTDTEANLARITEILDFLDQPVEAKVETRIYEIRYAEASQISSKLNELIADSQAKEDKPQINVAEATPGIPTPPGVIRARQAQIAAAAAAGQGGTEVDAALQLAERGVIQGKVKIIADDRTNILFVISRIENFAFFDRIVEVLDRAIDPAITVRVMALEYAKADEIAGILNEFIGAASSDSKTPGAATDGKPSDTDNGATDSRSQALRDYLRARTEQQAAAAAATPAGGVAPTSIGRLSADTKILADKRTNSILLMGKLNDLRILEDLVDQLDIMLAQVVIEAVIIEVTLSDEMKSGIAWIQKSMIAYQEKNVGPGGGVAVREPVGAWAGGTSLGVGDLADAQTLAGDEDGNNKLIPGGLTWFTSIYDLNIDAIIRLAESSRDAQILSTPVIVTTDNTEAKIIASTQRPVVTTTSTTDGGSIRSAYEYRDIGINLTVTPRINPQRVVVMEVNQTADDVAGEILIDGNLVPEITKRELNATVSVGDRETIALGGLILSRNAKSETKVPLLGDIPVIGNLFKFKSTEKTRSELVVLLTPYVLMTPAEARAESTRLYSANSSRQREWHAGWSDSPMGRISDRDKEKFLKDWEKNRPAPYVRELSTDLFKGEADKDKSKAKASKKTLFSTDIKPEEKVELKDEPANKREVMPAIKPTEMPAVIPEATVEEEPRPEREVYREEPAVPSEETKGEVQASPETTEVQPEPEPAEVQPVPADVDFSQPVPAR